MDYTMEELAELDMQIVAMKEELARLYPLKDYDAAARAAHLQDCISRYTNTLIAHQQ